jgi:hypothetical protein
MPTAMRLSISSFLLFGFILCTTLMGPILTQSARAESMGTLYGTVSFVGVQCAPGKGKVPPCDGPYPDFEVVLYKAGTWEMSARTRTDLNGHYEVKLPPGNYILRSAAEGPPAGQRVEEPSQARVDAGGRSRLDLHIDTGIR